MAAGFSTVSTSSRVRFSPRLNVVDLPRARQGGIDFRSDSDVVRDDLNSGQFRYAISRQRSEYSESYCT